MNLVAMMIVRNEMGRFLEASIRSLQGFCDEIRVVDDASTDGTADWLEAQDKVAVKRFDQTKFYEHEGAARQTAMRWAQDAKPTHIIAVDADEIVESGPLIREVLGTDRIMVWTLDMQEVWKADEHYLYTREDGGWRSHPVPICYQTVRIVGNQRGWMIPQKALASGRVPLNVAMNGRKMPSGANILHLGWSCEADRAARHARYVEHDSGRFHKSAHLDSIMWPDDKVTTRQRTWPIDMTDKQRAAMLARIRKGT